MVSLTVTWGMQGKDPRRSKLASQAGTSVQGQTQEGEDADQEQAEEPLKASHLREEGPMTSPWQSP